MLGLQLQSRHLHSSGLDCWSGVRQEGVSGVGEPWREEYKTGGRSGIDNEFWLRSG